MGTLIKLRNRAQITLPKEVVKTLGLKNGDDLEIEIKRGRVIITPIAVIPKDELWAWKPEIRAAIEEGRKEVREGKLKTYVSVDEMWDEIDAEEEFNAEI
ncbi:MAG: AbrB/MazE/SpoVT family DNA-binding domain-containing protein [Dethiobacter sp.]|jgi:AbrB family looped-hinge helix DNA binding protein|nr:AbrB/MazE/SpoVT family DNA-binding domain-containing protein [Dethiobacter sp.]